MNVKVDKQARKALRRAGIEKSALQFGALCFKRKGKQLRFLMITSRRTRRWVVPKGWPMAEKSPHAAAAQEAWEEAGARGEVSKQPVGTFVYRKDVGAGRNILCLVQVFPLEVSKVSARFPESGQRRVKWMKPKAAARAVAEPELARLIKAAATRLGASETPGQEI